MSLTVTIDTPDQSVETPTIVKPAPSSGISVLIIGAGPVGVFTALECWRKGHQVRILERSPVSSTQGDFFTVAPQVIKHIQTWPELIDENERIAPDPWISYHKLTGEFLTQPAPFNWSAQLKTESTDDRQHSPLRIYRHNRPKFLKMLIKQLNRLGIRVEYGHRAIEYYENNEKAGVVLDNNQKLEADVVVAADGIGTKSHKIVNGHDIRAWNSGLASFRTAFPVERIMDDPELRERFKILDGGHPHFELWHGPGTDFSVFRNEETISWLLMHKDTGTAKESWSETVSADKVLDHLTEVVPEFSEQAKKLIKCTPEDGIIDWKLMWRNPQPNIVSPLGRVVQVGDAAHTFLPSSGGGVNQGIEGAISLATCLQLGGKDGIKWATKIHNKLRFERVSCCQKIGFINQQRRHNPDTKAVERDPSIIKSEYGQWIWKHDPEQYARDNYYKALDHLQNGTSFQNTNIPPGHTYELWSVDDLMADLEAGRPIKFAGDWS
ncbi:putative monooxygenase [Camillea tinctor]|nr:putative monooxygenase [Camillea tinctor]